MQREFKVSLSPQYYSEVIRLSQYDANYPLIITVFDKTAQASINGMSAYFEGTRSDGLSFRYSGTAVGSKIQFTIDTALTAVAGKHTGEVVLYDGSGLWFGSANVQILVEKAARPDNAIDADVEEARSIVEQIQEIVDTAAETTAAAAQQIVGDLEEDLSAMSTATSSDVGKALKAKTVTNGKVTEWEFGEAGGGGSVETLSDVQISNLSNGQALTYDSTAQKWKNVTLGSGGSPFDLPTATNLITILRNCVFTKDVSIAIDNLAEALGVNSGGGDDDDMTFTYGQSIPKGNTARTLELTGMTIALTEIRLVVSLHSDFDQGGFCWVNAPNRGTPYVGVDANGDFYYSNQSSYSGSFSATPSNLSDFVNTIKEVKIMWLNPSGFESRKYLSGFKFFFNNYNPSCGYTLYRCSGFDGSTEVFRLESSGTNGELYDVLTGTTYTFNNTTGMEIVEVSE